MFVFGFFKKILSESRFYIFKAKNQKETQAEMWLLLQAFAEDTL